MSRTIKFSKMYVANRNTVLECGYKLHRKGQVFGLREGTNELYMYREVDSALVRDIVSVFKGLVNKEVNRDLWHFFADSTERDTLGPYYTKVLDNLADPALFTEV